MGIAVTLSGFALLAQPLDKIRDGWHGDPRLYFRCGIGLWLMVLPSMFLHYAWGAAGSAVYLFVIGMAACMGLLQLGIGTVTLLSTK
jgi:hypothetical protein